MDNKTDVEVKSEIKSPAYKEVLFKLSSCGKFGAIVSGKDVLRWIASRDEAIRFVREASAYECIISYEDRDKLVRLIGEAECLAMHENQVEFQVRESVQKLNSTLEAYQDIRRYMFTLSEKVDSAIGQRLWAEPPFNN